MIFLGLLVTFLLAGASLFLVLARVLRLRRVEEAGAVLLLALAAGPVTCSWIGTRLLLFLPGRADLFYVLLGTIPFLVPWVALPAERRLLLARLRVPVGLLRAPWAPEAVGWWLAGAAVSAFVVVSAMVHPLKENDPLEYAVLAKYLYRARSLAVYPVLSPDPATGYYDGVAHPPAFAGLQLWLMLWQRSAEVTPYVKLVAPAHWLLLLALLALALHRRRPGTGYLAVALLAGVPFLTLMAILSHIDPLRAVTFFLPFCALAWEGDRPRSTVLLGLCLAASLFSHSSGLVAVPLMAAAVLRLAPGGLRARARKALGVVALAGLLAGARYVDNCRLFGSPVNNEFPLFRPFLAEWKETFRAARQLLYGRDRLLFGLLRPFSQTGIFGVVFWLFLPAPFLRAARADRLLQLSVQSLALYFLFAALSLLFGVDLFIQNERYYLVLVPFAAYGAGIVLQELAGRIGARPLAALALLLLVPAARPYQTFLRLVPVEAATVSSTDDERLARNGMADHAYLKRLRDEWPSDGKVLVFRFGDFAYYAKRPFLRDGDPSLAALYRMETAEDAWRELRRLGVRYVSVPLSTPVSLSRTVLARLVSDPAYVDPIDASPTDRLFLLLETPRSVQLTPFPGIADWVATCRPADGELYRVRARVRGRGYATLRLTASDRIVPSETRLTGDGLAAEPRELRALFRGCAAGVEVTPVGRGTMELDSLVVERAHGALGSRIELPIRRPRSVP